MIKTRALLTLGLILTAATTLRAEKTDGLIVTSNGVEKQFAISEVREITFSDQGLTLIKTDDATVEFSPQWLIRFGEVETNGISVVEMTDENALVKVYNVEGVLVKELPLSSLQVTDFSKGVYIVSFASGKSFKIIR